MPQQQVAQEVEEARRRSRAAARCAALDRFVDVLLVLALDAFRLRAHVGPVDREARDHLAQRLVQLVARVVAVVAVALADLDEQRGQAVDVAAQHVAEDEVLLRAHASP